MAFLTSIDEKLPFVVKCDASEHTLAATLNQGGKLAALTKTTLEEHYVMVGELEGFYLDHFPSPNGKGQTLALQIQSAIKDTELEQKLDFIGSDGTPSMTGHTNGLIAALKRLLKRPLQQVICLLHCVELPLCHVFTALDGSTISQDSFCGPIGKKWDEFKSIPNQNFPILPNKTINDLCTDQYYAYKICWAVILGKIESD